MLLVCWTCFCSFLRFFYTNLQVGRTRLPCRLRHLHLHRPGSAGCWQPGSHPSWSSGVLEWWRSWTFPGGLPGPGGEGGEDDWCNSVKSDAKKLIISIYYINYICDFPHLSNQLLGDDGRWYDRLRLATQQAGATVPPCADYPGLTARVTSGRWRPPGRASSTASAASSTSAAAASCSAAPCAPSASASSIASVHARAPATPVVYSAKPRSRTTWLTV